MIGQYEKESILTIKTKMCVNYDCHVLRKLWIRIYNIFYELHEKQSNLKAFLKIAWTWSIGHCGYKSTVAQLLDMYVFLLQKLDLQKKLWGTNMHNKWYVGNFSQSQLKIEVNILTPQFDYG